MAVTVRLMQPDPTMMIKKTHMQRSVNRVLKGLFGALPAIPYVMRSRRRSNIAAYILGGIGVAALGGIAALMFLSPRTRTRALNAAKDTYDKMSEKIVHERDRAAEAANGLVERIEESTTGV